MRTPTTNMTWLRIIIPALCSLTLVAACVSGDSMTDPPTNDGRGTVPWDLKFEHAAITMLTGETFQLGVDAVDADGTPMDMSSMPPVEYEVRNDTLVTIDESGRISSEVARPSVTVIAKIHDVEGNWTILDTARVEIVDEAYDFDEFKLNFQGDRVQAGNTIRFFMGMVTDADGDPVLDAAGNPIQPLTHYELSAPRNVYFTANKWEGVGQPRGIGRVEVTGRANIFGKEVKDTTSLTVTYATAAILNIFRASPDLDPSPSVMSQVNITILKGGSIHFRNNNPTSPGDDIIFDDLENVIGGDIPVVESSPGSSVVQFPNVGEFTYTSTTIDGDIKGTITVVEPPVHE